MTSRDFITAALHLMACAMFGAGAWLIASGDRTSAFFGGFAMAMIGAMLIRRAVEQGIRDAK